MKKVKNVFFEGKTYSNGNVSRQYYLDQPENSDWKELVNKFLVLGEKHGLSNVRMVVFFFKCNIRKKLKINNYG